MARAQLSTTNSWPAQSLGHHFRTATAHITLATATKSMGWLRKTVDASTSVSSLPSEGTAMDAVAPKPLLLRPISAPAIKAIWEPETRTLTAGIVLGLVIIFAINYFRSPWRKLPPSPRRLPILGHALHLRDNSWLLSKDCKERFGQFTPLCTQVDANVCLRKWQERSCTWTVLGSP
jgi:hypothetical protein